MKYVLPEYKKYLEQLNNETEEHSIRVADLCKKYAKVEKVNEDIAYKVGLLHDIGKIFIPSRVLRKNAKLTPLEKQMIDLHSYYGYKMLKDIGEPKKIYMPILFHHGFGRSKLETITEPLDEKEIKLIRLVHSIDILDAVTQKRVYRGAMTVENALNILRKDDLCDENLYEAIKKNELNRE